MEFFVSKKGRTFDVSKDIGFNRLEGNTHIY